MIIKAIYFFIQFIFRIYHKGELIFQREPVAFQVIEDGKLIILGAYSVKSYPEGLYLDCEPETQEAEWEYPVQDGNELAITQVYSATQDGNVLEVE